MKGRIPSNIDLDKLVRDLKDKNGKGLRKDTKQKLKEGMVYFLTLLTLEVVKKKNLKDGYKKLNNKILEEIIGQKRPIIIRRILEQKGIIEVLPNGNYSESTGYRLTQKYCTGNFTEIEYSERIKNKLLEYKTKDLVETELGPEEILNPEILVDYPYLKEQFEKNKLTIKTFDSYNELREVLYQLLTKSLRKKIFKQETVVSLLNLIGGYKFDIEDIKDRNYKLNLSQSNLRFTGKLTSLKKELRKHLRVNGEKLVEVDIKSCQPFLLSTILNSNFTESTNEGYHLHTIFPDLFKELQNVKSSVPSNNTNRTEYISGVYLSPESWKELIKFIEYDFNKDFYEYILNNGQLGKEFKPSKIIKVKSKGRDYVKDKIMSYLFDRDDRNRSKNPVVEMTRSLFPELTDFIENFISTYGKSRFSILLQRTESYLVLNKICGFLNENHPDIPFFTIHDSILTTRESSLKVKGIMTELISEVTGKTPVISIKESNGNIDVDETWTKVNITSVEQFEKRKYSILKVDIEKGLSLISDQQLKTEVKEVIKPYMKNFQ